LIALHIHTGGVFSDDFPPKLSFVIKKALSHTSNDCAAKELRVVSCTARYLRDMQLENVAITKYLERGG
jgi:hypothetical protein